MDIIPSKLTTALNVDLDDHDLDTEPFDSDDWDDDWDEDFEELEDEDDWGEGDEDEDF